MASPRQIAANRRNAKSSSGPKTGPGKVAASRNALQHGLLSRDAMIPGESPTDFFAFTENLISEQKPIGELERALVERIGSGLWRLKRIGKLEAAILQHEHNRFHWSPSSRTDEPWSIAQQADAFMVSGNELAKLSRYETSIERSLFKTLHEFQRLQAARNGASVPTPVVVDIDVTGNS